MHVHISVVFFIIIFSWIHSGSWRDKQFKSYNFNALGAPVACGHLHPLMKVRAEIRQIFLEMG